VEIIMGEPRRRWSDDDKLAIVAETISTGNVTRTARRYGVNPSMVFAWRKKFGATAVVREAAPPAGFIPVLLGGDTPVETPADNAPGNPTVIEIDYSAALRMRIHKDADAGLAAAVARALAQK
jgi:transposase